MAESYPSTGDLNDLSGTSDTEQEVLYIAESLDPFHTDFYKMLYRLLDVARRAGDCRVYKDDSGDLKFGVRAGRYLNGDTPVNYAGATAEDLTDDSTNYIYLTAAGTLTVNTTGFPTPSTTPHIPLATIATGTASAAGVSGEYAHVDITDYRGRAILAVAAGLSAALAAEAAAFFAATDLAGAEAEQLSDGSNADSLHKHFGTEADTHESGDPNVLTAAESMKVLTNEGATGKNYQQLPSAAANHHFTFVVVEAVGMRVTAVGNDTIRVGDRVSIAGGHVESTNVGAVLVLHSINDTQWVALSAVGDWDVETS